jgi:hypothetical protein
VDADADTNDHHHHRHNVGSSSSSSSANTFGARVKAVFIVLLCGVPARSSTAERGDRPCASDASLDSTVDADADTNDHHHHRHNVGSSSSSSANTTSSTAAAAAAESSDNEIHSLVHQRRDEITRVE